jgi:hypothetical protein
VGMAPGSRVGKEHGVGAVPTVAMVRLEVARRAFKSALGQTVVVGQAE